MNRRLLLFSIVTTPGLFLLNSMGYSEQVKIPDNSPDTRFSHADIVLAMRESARQDARQFLQKLAKPTTDESLSDDERCFVFTEAFNHLLGYWPLPKPNVQRSDILSSLHDLAFRESLPKTRNAIDTLLLSEDPDWKHSSKRRMFLEQSIKMARTEKEQEEITEALHRFATDPTEEFGSDTGTMLVETLSTSLNIPFCRYGVNDPPEYDRGRFSRHLWECGRGRMFIDNYVHDNGTNAVPVLLDIVRSNPQGEVVCHALVALAKIAPDVFLSEVDKLTDERGYFDPLREQGVYVPLNILLSETPDRSANIRKKAIVFLNHAAESETGVLSRRRIDRILLRRSNTWELSTNRVAFLRQSIALSPSETFRQALSKELEKCEMAISREQVNTPTQEGSN